VEDTSRLKKVTDSKYHYGDWKVIRSEHRWTATRINPTKFFAADSLPQLLEKLDAADDPILTVQRCSFSEIRGEE